MAKLTLTVDDVIIQRAKIFARTHKTSVSRLVANYLNSLEETQGGSFRNLHAKLKAGGYSGHAFDEKAARRQHTAEKYGF